MKYGINTIDDLQLKNKTVLCRVDMNSPLKADKSGFTDTTRIQRCAPTIKEMSNKKAKLVVMTHQGADVEYHNYYNTEPHSRELSKWTGKEVKYIDDVCGPAARAAIQNLKPGQILLLDNVRFMAEEQTLFETKLNLTPEEQADTQVVKKLAPLGDYYVCDAFAAAHRAQPTLLGFAERLPSAMGRLFEEEYEVLSEIMEAPQRPSIFILGGAKIHDAFRMMNSTLEKGIADYVLTGGLVANVMLLADGIDLGTTSTQFLQKNNYWQFVELSKNILENYRDKIILPEDMAFVESNNREELDIESLLDDKLFVDIGYRTVEKYNSIISSAKTIFFNGPMGVFEQKESEYGTKKILTNIAEAEGFSVIGGGDSITAINKYGLANAYSYICTGGGALIRFLSGEELPVINALKKASKKTKSVMALV